MNNRIRLPLYIKQPQFPTEANRFRLADGSTKTLSVVIRKTYELETDYLPEKMHQRLVIALNHDSVTIEGDRYAGGVAMDGEYEIEYPGFLDYPLGKASARLQVTPFNVTNDNCKTCEEAGQLDLADDTFEDPISEGDTGNINVFENDAICCSPITASIVTFNTTFVDSATIDEETGVVTVTIKDPAPSGTNVLLATYRVICPDGSYDEANIYGTIEGSTPSCEPASNVVATSIGIDTATVEWGPSPSTPDGYGWQLFKCDDLGTIINQGTTPVNAVNLSGLTAATCYRLVVWPICDDVTGETTYGEFITDMDLPNCGKFLLNNVSHPDPPASIVSYMDCGGQIQQIVVKTTREVCMMTDSLNIPTYFVVEDGAEVTHTYQEPC